MKKVYLGLFALAIAGTASAQIANKNISAKRTMNINEVSPKTSTNYEKATPFYTNDFATPAQWVTANAGGTGTPPHTLGDWAITTNTSAVPVTALQPAGHSTAANGYALINSDAAGTGQTQNATIVTANVINCTGKANVSMIFEQSTRHYQESYFVVVSNDGGTTWTEFPVNTTMAVNSNSPNPQIIQVNISTVAANQANVKIGFKYVGAYDWFWAVDDVKLVETDNYDLSINGLYWGAEGFYGERLAYYSTPLAQIAPIHFGGLLENKGAMTQTDCVFNVAIASAGYSSNSNQGTLAPNGIDTLDANATFTPGASAATYAVTSGVTSGNTDANNADNSFNTLSFTTNQNVYARDAQVVASGSYNQGMGYEMGNVFDIFANTTLYGADIHVATGTTVGAEFYASLYSFDAQGNFVFVDQTPLHAVTSGELGTVVTLAFNAGLALTADNSYVLVVGSYGDGGATDDFVVGTSGVSAPQTTFYLEGNDNTGTWFYSTSTAMVRMNFNSALSINENTLNASVNVFPNPAVNEFTVTVEGNDATAITVVDLTGKVVYSAAVNGTATVNTTNFAAGMYTVNVETTAGTATKKLIVRN